LTCAGAFCEPEELFALRLCFVSIPDKMYELLAIHPEPSVEGLREVGDKPQQTEPGFVPEHLVFGPECDEVVSTDGIGVFRR
jgi:hypothetical protein